MAILIGSYLYDFFATLYTIGSSILISAYFFKYQFKQLNTQITLAIQNNQPVNQLKQLISVHNSIILELVKFDSEMNYYLYILIKVIKPAFNTFVFLLFEPRSEWHFLIYVGLTVAVNSLFFFGATSTFASAT